MDFDKKLKSENIKLKKWVTNNYGPRCPDYLKDCIVCQKWKLFDKLKIDD
jgi:hypothetical protein